MMFKPSKRSKTLLSIAILAALLLVVLAPTILRTAKTKGPLRSAYLRYSKWRYNWRSPSDLGDGKNARQIIIESPMGIAEDRLGNLYVTDRDTRLVWKIEPSGRATVIAGTGKTTDSKGIPRLRVLAQDIDFASPEGLVVDRDGNILLADSLNHAILKIDADGYLTRVVGNGQSGFNGDGIQATEASLNLPYDVRLDSQGNVYIADVNNHRIRKVNTSGVISTVAGTGVAGYSGDGGPAVNARLHTPYGILLDNDDNLLIADSDNNVVRKVGRDGVIHTVAGTGQRGYGGDGGSALAATLDSPQSLGIDTQGRIYIGDEHNNAIRILERDGTVQTLVGTKGPGFSGDGGAASAAQIADPENIWVRKDGTILISARDNSRLRIVFPDGTINSFAGRGPTAKHSYFAPVRLQPVEP